jgi:hypothetical protein
MTQLTGNSSSDDGVLGVSQATGKAGVAGVNEDGGLGGGNGVYGRGSGNGVFGISTATTAAGGAGVVGTCDTNDGVRGFSKSPNHSGVVGTNNDGGIGVLGQVNGANAAVAGVSSSTGPGVVGRSTQGEGVRGESASTHGGVVGVNSGTGAGVFGQNTGSGPAAFFEGNVEVTGDVLLRNADCAEDFDVAGIEDIEAGTVMVLSQEGTLQPSKEAYDKKVAGVISGAGHYVPGMILDRQKVRRADRKPVALLGKVFCKVDASHGAVEVGDLLTTSSTFGHAMKAEDSSKAFGAVIGKALRPLREGQGLIPILVALQ